MKAMILAAGQGTRLRPLTDNRPKALVELADRSLLEVTLTRLRTFGISEVIINVHHFADMITDYLKYHNNFGMRVEISREEVLLGTGGGLKKAAWFFLEDPTRLDEPFLLHNVDIISSIDFQRMLQFHTENHALASLAVQSRETSRYLLFNERLQLCGRRSPSPAAPGRAPQTTAEQNSSRSASPPEETAMKCHSERSEESAVSETQSLQALAFSGIHIISPRLLSMLTEEGIFSIIPAYLRLSAKGEAILAFRADNCYWRDVGRPADLAQAAHDFQQKF
jgi:NDP-sugar pyrophosphorylase family protein